MSVLACQCLYRGLASITEVRRQVNAWQDNRHQAQMHINWRFTAEGARIKLKRGGGVGMVSVADSIKDAARRVERVLTNDPATRAMRRADAGCQEAIQCAREKDYTCRW